MTAPKSVTSVFNEAMPKRMNKTYKKLFDKVRNKVVGTMSPPSTPTAVDFIDISEEEDDDIINDTGNIDNNVSIQMVVSENWITPHH